MKRRPMPTVMSTLALTLTAGLATGCPGTDDGNDSRAPYRDGWVPVIDQGFSHVNGEGEVQISSFSIGGRENNDNFANRGDVIVNFDGPANSILVEFRRFSFAPAEDIAKTDFDALSVWAYDDTVGPPNGWDEETNCITNGWTTGCEVRVYYDGQSQLKRSGADIRVTLPSDYRQKIDIVTEDNVEDEDYFNRGNVCISGMNGSATVQTESGNIWVTLARETKPAPKCDPEDIVECENWPVEEGTDMGSTPWAPDCPCLVGGGDFGQLLIENRPDTASDIKVDMPAGLWTSISAENKGEGQEASGEHCEANVNVPDAMPDETGNDFPWTAKYAANYPGMPAFKGAGYNINAASNSCAPVAFTESPADFVGVDQGSEQKSSERGNIEICSDCIVQSCSELIP